MATRTPLFRSAGLAPDIVEKFSGGGAAANVAFISTIKDAGQKMVIRQAFAWSMRNMWIFYACIGGIAVVASFFIKKEALGRDPHVETKTGISEMKEKGAEEDIELRVVV
jgi:hypothetical protein